MRPTAIKLVPFALLALLLTALAGCGKSKEEQVMDKIRGRKQPGLVRLVNFSDTPLQLYWQEREVEGVIAPGSHSRFRPIGAGDHELVAKNGATQVLTIPVTVEAQQPYTVVAHGSGSNIKYTVVSGEAEYPTPTENVKAFFLDGSGKPSTGEVTLSIGSNKYVLSEKSAPQLVNAGSFTLSGSGLANVVGELLADTAYSIIVFKSGNGKANGLVLQNTFREMPTMGGTS